MSLNTMLDSGSGRSRLTLEHFRKLQEANSRLRCSPTDFKYLSASGQSLEIMGEIKIGVKIYVYTWNWVFLVRRALCGPPILGADFIAATKMILDLAKANCYFAFAPSVGINFVKGDLYASCLRTHALAPSLPEVQTGPLLPEGQNWGRSSNNIRMC
jgi:hypothetical protein